MTSVSFTKASSSGCWAERRLRFAVGFRLALRRLEFLQRVDVRLDDRDALRKLVELGGREVAPRGGRRLARRKADQLLLEQVELRRACAALGDRAARRASTSTGLASPAWASSGFSSASSACFSADCSSRAAVARVAISRRRVSSWSRSALSRRGLAVRGVERLLGLGERKLVDTLRELFFARLLLQRVELLLGFRDALGRPLGGLLEARGGRGARRRRLEMAERGAQQRERLVADIRGDIGARLELLDARFHALDGAVGGFGRFVATRGRCGTRCRNGSLRRRICLGRTRRLRGRRRFFRRRHGLCCRRRGLGRCRCLSVTRHGHRQQSKQERAASQFQTGEFIMAPK